jgi:hypothetical protein
MSNDTPLAGITAESEGAGQLAHGNHHRAPDQTGRELSKAETCNLPQSGAPVLANPAGS